MAKISSVDINKISSNKFRSVYIGGKKTSGVEIKKIISKMAYGGKTSARIMDELKKEGVRENIRKSYSNAIEGKKKDKSLIQKQKEKDNYEQQPRKQFFGLMLNEKNTSERLGATKSNSVISITQTRMANFGKNATASTNKPGGIKPTIKLTI